MYEIREAQEKDRKQTVNMLVRVFKDVGNFEEGWTESWQNYMNHPENEDWDYVATHDGVVVANLAFFANSHNMLRGGPVRFGGVWAVATEREHRRKGLLRSIFNKVFPIMREKGVTLSILEPSPYQWAQFSYERLGYEVVEQHVRHEFNPLGMRQFESREDITARLLDDVEEWKQILELEKSMTQYGSRVFTWPGFLAAGIKSGNFYIFEREGSPVGCVNLSIDNGAGGKELHMMNVYFVSLDIMPSILGIVRQRATDVSKVIWNYSPQVPLQPYFQNVHMLHSEIGGTMMMRVIDFEGYCHSIRASEAPCEELTLELIDKECPWNEGIYQIRAYDGALEVEHMRDGGHAEITLTPNDLSRVVGGIEGPSVLQKIGILECHPDAAEKLEAFFPQDSFVSYFRF